MFTHITRLFTTSPTFAHLAHQWLADARQRLKPAWVNQADLVLRREILPVLGTIPMHRIGRPDIRKVLDRTQDRPATAAHCLSAIRTIFQWAIGSARYDGANPARDLRAPRPKARSRCLSELEIKALWHGVEGMDDYTRIFRLLLATGARRAEIGDLQWSEIVPGNGGPRIELPPARNKSNQMRLIPLTALAIAQLPPAPPSGGNSTLFDPYDRGSPFLFGRGPGGFRGWSGAARWGWRRRLGIGGAGRRPELRVRRSSAPGRPVDAVPNDADTTADWTAPALGGILFVGCVECPLHS